MQIEHRMKSALDLTISYLFSKVASCFTTIDSQDEELSNNNPPKKIERVIFPDRPILEGEFKDGFLEGFGRYADPDRFMYEGEFKGGSFEGFGRYVTSLGGTYEGEFKDDCYEGFGRKTLPDGDSYVAKFSRDKAVGLNRTNIGDLLFFKHFYSFTQNGTSQENLIQIILDYLIHRFQNDFSLKPIISALKNLSDRSRDNLYIKSTAIYRQLQSNQKCLIPFGYEEHAMLLYLIPNPDKKNIECEIFNSGEGLNFYHKENLLNNKCQTIVKIIIPREKLTKKKIKEWLNHNDWETIDQAYNSLLEIPGAKLWEQQEPSILLKNRQRGFIYEIGNYFNYLKYKYLLNPSIRMSSPQKGPTCSIKSIFEFLKHKWPTISGYKEMRRQLFIDSLEAVLAKNPERREEILAEPRVQHKRKKLDF